MTERTILFSGGGTVGHLAPGFALADALASRGLVTCFATPGEAREAAWFAGREPPVAIPAVRLPRGPGAAIAFPLRLARCVRGARRVLRARSVDCVVALGGWPCAPAALAARAAGATLVLYAADAVPGRVVRWLRRRADRIYVAHESARAALGGDAHVCGPLLRAAIAQGRRDATRFGLRADRATLLVTGGSLGARGLNERLLSGLEDAVGSAPSLADRFQVIHAAGDGAPAVAKRYVAMGVAHHVVPFLSEIGHAYATCDLLVGRAGAGTCDEVEALGLPALLVPYPHHADQQQARNAARLSERVPAVSWVEEAALDSAVVADQVLGRLQSRRPVEENLPFRDAATETASDLIRFLGWERSSGT